MRSKAHISSHPIHPMLIAFPVAFLSGTFIFDVLAVILHKDDLWHTAYYLEIAGIVSALVAAIPGIIDFVGTVPPNSSAKKRGAQHGLINVTHLIIFCIAWWLRRDEEVSRILILSLETTGVTLLSIAGWLGGTLVYRNQIGVDPRYANAGKWKEEYFEKKGSIRVAALDELQVNQMKLLHVAGKRIVLGRTEEGYVAFDDHCTHRGGSLAGGSMICGTVQCPWHGSQFNITTGEVVSGPAKAKIDTYPVSERDGKVYLQL
jgi:nitrite reductase/ring-hydroxylating ferredoxin subunit/uncharacterized membrane protein